MLHRSWLQSLARLCLVYCIAHALALHEPFDVREVTIESIHNALTTDLTSCREIVTLYLTRIEAINSIINAIISLNPDALRLADAADEQLACGVNITAFPLFCIPILLKDNFDATPTNTTGGCIALAGNKPNKDGPVVAALKQAGVIVLGKTNLHEMALEGLTVSSLGGQTHNPYDLSRTPGGSSGGTGAAIAANLAVIGTGTDTMNSLRSPAASNSLFSIRPTWGLVSRVGVIPVSYTQDTVGPIARTVRDLAVALTVMASVGRDSTDNATLSIPDDVLNRDYTAHLAADSLRGFKLGVVSGFFDHMASSETTPVNEVMEATILKLSQAGATIVNLAEPVFNSEAIKAALDVQRFEYREALDSYLANAKADGSIPAGFLELYQSGKTLVIPAQVDHVRKVSKSSTADAEYKSAKQGIQQLIADVREIFAQEKLDGLLYPEQKNLVVNVGSPSQSGRNGILAAVTGFPSVAVPVGFSQPSASTPIGIPIGMEILGLPWTDDKLLNIAYHIEELLHARRPPLVANTYVEATQTLGKVPIIVPGTSTIPDVYPIRAVLG